MVKESKVTKPKYVPTDDSYKFGSWCARKIVFILTGREFGDSNFDENVGTALSAVYPALDLCQGDKNLEILVHACAGAWKGVKK